MKYWYFYNVATTWYTCSLQKNHVFKFQFWKGLILPNPNLKNNRLISSFLPIPLKNKKKKYQHNNTNAKSEDNEAFRLTWKHFRIKSHPNTFFIHSYLLHIYLLNLKVLWEWVVVYVRVWVCAFKRGREIDR